MASCSLVLFILFYLFMTVKAKVLTGHEEEPIFFHSPDDEINVKNSLSLRADALNPDKADKVEISVYYETGCWGCKLFHQKRLSPAVEKLDSRLDVHPYPYGFAKTIVENGKIKFICPQGPQECYGNKVHACSIDHFKNMTEAVLFNNCLFTLGEGDEAVDSCGEFLSVNSEPIKTCAKGDRGDELLKHIGEESEKVQYDYVPYVLVNGKLCEDDETFEDFMEILCKEFKEMPAPCKEFTM